MLNFNSRDIHALNKTLERSEKVFNEKTELKYLLDLNPRLIISPSNQCNSSCLHCASDSMPNGEFMPYSAFENIDQSFFNLFSTADFGRRGDPVTYKSQGHDLADLIEILIKNGIKYFTIAAGIHPEHLPVTDKLVELNSKVKIGTMITYHHYFEKFEPKRFAQNFNLCLKNYFPFSNEIDISILGDGFSYNKPTMGEKVKKTFHNNWEIIFSGIEMEKIDSHSYKAEYNNKTIKLVVRPLKEKVYPMGRFRDYLVEKNLLKEYEKNFEALNTYNICPDLLKWPAILLEYNGNLNLCGSFESLHCDNAVVSNIFTKSFQQVEKDLLNFHRKEHEWFLTSFSDIIKGKKVVCKMKEKY